MQSTRRVAVCGFTTAGLLLGTLGAAHAADAPTDAYGEAVLATQPDFFWRFDEAPGSTEVADSSGHGIAGLVRQMDEAHPTATFGGEGLDGGSSVHFARGTAGATITPGAGAPTPQGDGSAVLWVRSSGERGPWPKHPFEPWEDDPASQILIHRGDPGISPDMPISIPGHEMVLYYTGTARAEFFVNGPNRANVPLAGGDLHDGQWHQLSLVELGNVTQLYVDGVRTDRALGGIGEVSASPWTLGNELASALDLDVDEVSTYSRGLSALEIATLYAAGTGAPAPVFDETTRPVASFTGGMAQDGAPGVEALKLNVNARESAFVAPGAEGIYRWDFGDGTTVERHGADAPRATATGATHTYAAPGTYTVTLTVVDDLGRESLPVSREFTVGAQEPDPEPTPTPDPTQAPTPTPEPSPTAPADLLSESFDKPLAKSWGSAWDLSLPSSFSVTDTGRGAQKTAPGVLSIANAKGSTPKGLTIGDFSATFDVVVPKATGGSGTHVQHQFWGAGLGRDGYSAKVVVAPDGTLTVQLMTLSPSGGTLLASQTLPRTAAYTSGTALTLRVTATADGEGGADLSTTLSSGALSSPVTVSAHVAKATTTGRYGVATYVSSAASAPQQVLYDLVRVTPLG